MKREIKNLILGADLVKKNFPVTNKLERSESGALPQPLLANVRHYLKVMPGTNALAYLSGASMTKKKKFYNLGARFHILTIPYCSPWTIQGLCH